MDGTPINDLNVTLGMLGVTEISFIEAGSLSHHVVKWYSAADFLEKKKNNRQKKLREKEKLERARQKKALSKTIGSTTSHNFTWRIFAYVFTAANIQEQLTFSPLFWTPSAQVAWYVSFRSISRN